MTYEWDPVKARTNIRKHGIDFADAATVFSDDNARTIPDEYPGGSVHVAWPTHSDYLGAES